MFELVAGFLNSHGGHVLVGVNERGPSALKRMTFRTKTR